MLLSRRGNLLNVLRKYSRNVDQKVWVPRLSNIRSGQLFCRRHQSSNVSNLKKTCLYDLHVQHEGKMVPFAGYLMPVQYGSYGIGSSHIHTREHVSLFDVSHMLQSYLVGEHAIEFIESLVVGDIQGLKENQGTLTLYTNVDGGIIDDLIVTKTSQGYLFIVSNAGCADKDLAHVKFHLEEFKKSGKEVDLKVVTNRALLAVQGPGTAKVLQPLIGSDLTKLPFMMTTVTDVCGVNDCRVTRCGYTGEDGVEISVPESGAQIVVETLLKSKDDDVRLAGLGARDTLRLEAGLCLYGNDIDDNTTPIEAGLAWTIGKRRRAQGGFPGDEIILKQLKNKPLRRRVGFISEGAPARSHTAVLDSAGVKIGEVTSGCPSPSLKQNIAMGYIEAQHAVAGSKVTFEVRKHLIEATVSKMPFVAAKYYNPK